MAKNLYIFDCFGVVISNVSGLWMNKRLNAEQQEFMCKNVFRSIDTGKTSMEWMFDIICEKFGMQKETVKKEWADEEFVLTDTVDLIRKLRANGDTVALLSNASKEYVDYLFDRFDLNRYFDKIFVSSVYGCAKPDKVFYKICVKSFDEKFENIYFTDDTPGNLLDLEQFGIKPVLFKNAKDFKRAVGLKD